MTNAQAWAMLVALAVPFATGLLVKASWPAWVKFLVSLVLSVAVGFVTIGLDGELTFTWSSALVTVAAVVGAAQFWFRYIIDRVPGLKEWLYSIVIRD